MNDVQKWIQKLFYFDSRIAAVGLMGFFSGLPLPLTAGTLFFWLSENKIDISSVALFSLAGLPYVLKFLWAPFVDQVHLTIFSLFFGQRRGWIIFCQIALIGIFMAFSFTNPLDNLKSIAVLAIMCAFFSATQDIALDAYRIETLKPIQYGPGSAAAVSGYRLGMVVASGGAINFSGVYGWESCFVFLACLMALGIVLIVSQPEPFILTNDESENASVNDSKRRASKQSFSHFFQQGILTPLQLLMRKKSWKVIFSFILSYKLCDSVLMSVTNDFYLSLGFSDFEIGTIVGGVGIGATIMGALLGGFLIARCSLFRMLSWGVFLQLSTNALYLALKMMGHNPSALLGLILVENFCSGIGTITLVAYLSQLCTSSMAATQYALLTAISTLGGKILLASFSGFIVAHLGWTPFFIYSILLGVPALIMAKYLTKHESGSAAIIHQKSHQQF